MEFASKRPKSDLDYSVVLAHGPCHDGITAAWAAYRRLSEASKDRLAELAQQYTEGATSGVYARDDGRGSGRDDGAFELHARPALTSLEGARALQQLGAPTVFAFLAPQTRVPSELVRGRRVLVVDLDLGECLDAVVEAAAFVLLLDHHKSGEAAVRRCGAAFPADRFRARFDTALTESGASLSWKEFHPGELVPPLVEAVQIADTWNFEQSPLDVQAVSEALYTDRLLRDFGTIEKTHIRWLAEPREYGDALVARGAAFKVYQDAVVRSVAHKSAVMYVAAREDPTAELRWRRGLVVNAGTLNSFVGNAMRVDVAAAYERAGTRIDFCAIWSYLPEDRRIVVSLRGPGTGVDLSVLARTIEGEGKERGGGHPKAAGFSIVGLEHFNSVFSYPDPPANVAEWTPPSLP